MAARQELLKVNVLALQYFFEDLVSQLVGLVHGKTLHELKLIEIRSILKLLNVLLLHPIKGHQDVSAEVDNENVVHALDEVLELTPHFQPGEAPDSESEDVGVCAVVEIHSLLGGHVEPTDDGALTELQSVHLLGIELVADVVLARHNEEHLGRGLKLRAYHLSLLELAWFQMLQEIYEELVIELIFRRYEWVILESLPVVFNSVLVVGLRLIIHCEEKQILFALFTLVSDLEKSLELPHKIGVAEVFEDH